MVTVDYTEKEKELLQYIAQGYQLYNNIADPVFIRQCREENLTFAYEDIRIHDWRNEKKYTEAEKMKIIQNYLRKDSELTDRERTEPELKRARAWKSGEYDNKRHVFTTEERRKEKKTFLKFFFLILTAPAWLPFYIILQVFLITGVMGDGNGGDRWHM